MVLFLRLLHFRRTLFKYKAFTADWSLQDLHTSSTQLSWLTWCRRFYDATRDTKYKLLLLLFFSYSTIIIWSLLCLSRCLLLSAIIEYEIYSINCKSNKIGTPKFPFYPNEITQIILLYKPVGLNLVVLRSLLSLISFLFSTFIFYAMQ